MKKLPLFKTLLLSCSLCVCAATAQASLLITETFDYAPPYDVPVDGLNGGTGWKSAWLATENNGTARVVDFRMSAPTGYNIPIASPALRLRPANNATRDAVRSLSTGINLNPTAQTDCYFSYLWMRVDNPDAGGEASFFSLRSASGVQLINFGVQGDEKLYIGVGADANGGTAVAATGSYTLDVKTDINTTGKYLIVGKMELNAAGEADTLYLSAIKSDQTLTEITDWDVMLTGDFSGSVGRLVVTVSAYGQDAYFDNILIGTTFADVTGYIPEPAVSATLLGLLPLALALRRRRR